MEAKLHQNKRKTFFLQEGSMLVALISWASQLGHMTFFKAIVCAGTRAAPTLQRDKMLLGSREGEMG